MKNFLKNIINLTMKLLSLPFYLSYLFLFVWVDPRKAFSSVMQGISLFPGISGEWLRRGVLQWITKNELTDACISFGSLFSDPALQIGNGVYIGPRCDIGKVNIGKDTIIGSNVIITSGLNQHGFDRLDIPIRDQAGRFETIVVGQDSWIGSGAMILADIGSGCIIGAGSVVVKPIPDFAIVMGNPGAIIRYRK